MTPICTKMAANLADARVFSGESKESVRPRHAPPPCHETMRPFSGQYDRSDVDRGDSEVACEAERLPESSRFPPPAGGGES